MTSPCAAQRRSELRPLGLCRAGLAALALLWSAGPAFGWGSGHVTQAELVLRALPQELRDFFPEALHGI